MWEYKLKCINFRLYSQLVEELNIDGNENWEVVSYEADNTYCKNSGYTAKVLYKRMKSSDIIHPKEKQLLNENTIKESSQKDNTINT